MQTVVLIILEIHLFFKAQSFEVDMKKWAFKLGCHVINDFQMTVISHKTMFRLNEEPQKPPNNRNLRLYPPILMPGHIIEIDLNCKHLSHLNHFESLSHIRLCTLYIKLTE